MSKAYYNENDPKAAAWLRELIKRGLIAPGTVDERSIADVQPGDLEGYDQHHFFAGIGVWSYALRKAGWPDDRPVWTGSCPCQPFSAAGKGLGTGDPRHLWPEWFRLIEKQRPAAIFGEQVAGKNGLDWVDAVHADLEGIGYAVGALDLAAAGFGAPHARQRLYFVAESDRDGRQTGGLSIRPGGSFPTAIEQCGDGEDGNLADTENADGRTRERGAQAGARQDGERGRGSSGDGPARKLVHPGFEGLEGHAGNGDERDEPGRIGTDKGRPASATGASRVLGDPEGLRSQGRRHGEKGEPDGESSRGGRPVGPGDGDRGDTEMRGRGELRHEARQGDGGHTHGANENGGMADTDDPHSLEAGGIGKRELGLHEESGDDHGAAGIRQRQENRGPCNGFWRNAEWIPCRDGKWRPAEPGTFPLAHGTSARVVRLRGYGNAIVAPVAEEFVRAYLEARR